MQTSRLLRALLSRPLRGLGGLEQAAGSSSLSSAAAKGAHSQLSATAAAPQLVTAAAEGAAEPLAASLARARRMAGPVGVAAGVVGAVAGSGGAAVIVPLISRSCGAIPQR